MSLRRSTWPVSINRLMVGAGDVEFQAVFKLRINVLLRSGCNSLQMWACASLGDESGISRQ